MCSGCHRECNPKWKFRNTTSYASVGGSAAGSSPSGHGMKWMEGSAVYTASANWAPKSAIPQAVPHDDTNKTFIRFAPSPRVADASFVRFPTTKWPEWSRRSCQLFVEACRYPNLLAPDDSCNGYW